MDALERDGLRFHVRDSGPRDGEVAVLLHGFPQSSSSWDLVAPLLHDAGLRTVVPDQRGYSPTARPQAVDAYRMAELVADAVALIEATGPPPVRLVGHDWGAAVAWNVAARRPDLVSSLTAVSVPHPAAFAASMRGSTQPLRSWYMAAFQTPLAERMLDPSRPRGRERFVGSLVDGGQTPERAGRDVDALAAPGALSAALAWYRAARRDGATALPGPVTVPTCLVWGGRDVALGFDGVRRTTAYVSAPYRLDVLPDASHWIPEERPGFLARAILSVPTDPPSDPPSDLPPPALDVPQHPADQETT